MINTCKLAINLRAKLQIWPKKVLSSCSLMSDVFQEFSGNAERISNLAEMEWNDIESSLSLARFYKSCEQSTRVKFKETKEIRKSSYSFPEDENFPHKTMGSNLQIFPSAQQVSLTLTSGWAVISLTLFSLLYLISFISLTFLLGDHSQRLCFYTVK